MITDAHREALRLRENRRRDLEEVVRDHVCARCGGLLGMWCWWDGNWMLACMAEPGHKGFRRLHGQAEAYRCGEYVSPYVAQVFERKGAKRMTGTDLAKLDEKGMLARVDMARFPEQLNATQKKMVANVAMTYGLDPLMGELTVYQGNPYVSIDGRYRKARETGLLDGVESRPATKDERADWQIPEGDYFFRAQVFVKGTTRPFVGWGRVRQAEMAGKSSHLPVVAVPQRMAEKRAEAQALRKAFGIPLPSFGGESATPMILEVDTETGEVIENEPRPEAREVPPEDEHAPSAATDVTNSEPPLAPPKLSCVNDLTKAAHDRYGLQPPEVYRILGIKSAVEVGPDLEEAWGRIVASQE